MDDRSDEDLRRELVRLKTETLSVQAVKMGLSHAGGDISERARRTIEESVAGLNREELRRQIAHWADLRRRVSGTAPDGPLN